MAVLSFYIDGPLQSWGASSKFQYRETNGFPTKSAIVGLLAAAMGIDKHAADEGELLQPIVTLRCTVVRLEKEVAPVTRLQDFHTVGGGYDKKASLYQKLSMPVKASGAPFGTVITRRSYLTDATFAVLLDGDAAVLEDAKAALLDPVWGVWFGRKACLPATPLSPQISDTLQGALDELLAFLPGHEPTALDMFEYQQERNEGDFYQSDEPVAFGKHHGAVPLSYRARGIVHHRPSNLS
jgi:CRISPR system Cascade subunit CasD